MCDRGQYVTRRRLIFQIFTILSIFLIYSCRQAASAMLQRTLGRREDNSRSFVIRYVPILSDLQKLRPH